MKKKILLLPLLTVMLIVALIVGTGCAGDTGLKGSRGPEGSQGVQGEQGDQGEPGLQGEVGLQGDAGIQGVMGRTGMKGATGSAGVAGATGEQGIQGGQGPQGVSGSGLTGATGLVGPEGPIGPQGDKGDTGDTGPLGPVGEDGENYDSQALLALQEQIATLEDIIATLPRPQLDGISPLVLSTSTPEVLTGIVELVFDFYDADNDLRDLMIDWSFEPYTQERKAQTNFLATEDMGIDPGVLAAMAEVGLVPSYNAEEQSWTLRIDTNATMTQAILDTGIFGWVEEVGDPVFPAGRYDWYIEVRDFAGNKWGNMMAPPAYSHYVNYFHSDS